MDSGTFVKIIGLILILVVAIVLILGIGTLFKGGETSKKYSNKLMQLRVLIQFIAIIVLVSFAYFFKN
jgi:small-conductance mechanosensitive channel